MRKKKVIGLVGFFGWGNYGDELFLEVYKQWLGNEFELRVLHDIQKKPYFSGPISEALDGVDAIIIGGGDLVMPWTVSGLYWRPEYLEKPVYVVGVGVPTWRGGNNEAIKQMAEFFQHSNIRMINARDQESAKWIRRHLKPNIDVKHSTDIVFGMKFPEVTLNVPPILGIVTRDRKGRKDPLEEVENLCKKAIATGYGVRHIVLGISETGIRDASRAADLDIQEKELVRSEDLMSLTKAIGECAILASMKFHGTVVAVAYGRPSLVLSPTDKSRNLMRMIERPELLSSLNDSDLSERFSPYMASIPNQTRHLLRRRAIATLNELIDELRDI